MVKKQTQTNSTLFDLSTFLTQQEVAQLLRITVPTVIKLRKSGKLKYAELGTDGARKKPIYPKSQFSDNVFSVNASAGTL